MEGKFLRFNKHKTQRGKRLDFETKDNAVVPEDVFDVRTAIAHDTGVGVAAIAADESAEVAMSGYDALADKIADILWRAHKERMQGKAEVLQTLLDARAEMANIDKSRFSTHDFEIAARLADELAAQPHDRSAKEHVVRLIKQAVKEWR